MYERLKSIAKTVLPSSFLKNNQSLLRSIIALSYHGNNYSCNICNFSLRNFITLKNGDLLCPNCGSLPRTRRLWDVIKNDLISNDILHFSPPLSLKNRITSIATNHYVTTDYNNCLLYTSPSPRDRG